MDDARRALLEAPPHRMVEHIEAELGLSRGDLADALGVDPRTLQRWYSGQSYPQREARHRLFELDHLRIRLRHTFTSSDAVHSWMRVPSAYLSQLTPLEVLRAGRPDRVEAALEALDSGIFI